MIIFDRQAHWFLGGNIVARIERKGYKGERTGWIFALLASRKVKNVSGQTQWRVSACVTQDPTGKYTDTAIATFHVYARSEAEGLRLLVQFLRLNYGEVGNRPRYHTCHFGLRMLGSNSFVVMPLPEGFSKTMITAALGGGLRTKDDYADEI